MAMCHNDPWPFATNETMSHEDAILDVLPLGFHRIRHYGLLANGGRRANLATARQLLMLRVAMTPGMAQANEPSSGMKDRPCRPNSPITRSTR